MNRKINTLIIDDQAAAIKKLSKDLESFSDIQLIDAISIPEKAKKAILREQPDLLFLDIVMPGISGLELLQEIRNDIHTHMRIVFYTAYNEYLIDALRSSAFDFLQKPYLPEELATIIQRCRTQQSIGTTNIEQTLCKLINRNNQFAIQTITGLVLVKSEEIFLFQFNKEQRSWHMNLNSGKIHKLRISTTAKELLSINNSFVQISQDCIINLQYLIFIENGSLECQFCSPFENEKRTVSHRYYKKLKDKLDII